MNIPQQKPISILFEDEYVLVVNKPAGIIVNKADTTKNEVTVQEWAEEYLKIAEVSKVSNVSKVEKNDYAELNRKAFFERSGIVHRLDKETSGALVLAKNSDMFVEMLRQFRERLVKKTYVALAHGKVIPSEGEINVPIGRLPWNRKLFGVVAGGREALTRYEVVQYYKDELAESQGSADYYSFLELYPETGRTHQIRVHLKYIGHPIFADYLYAGRKTQRENRKILSRVFLHAAKIAFSHPKTHEPFAVTSPLPEELQHVLDTFVRV